MSLHRFVRVGWYDLKRREKIWSGYLSDKWYDHRSSFYDIEVVISRHMPSHDGKKIIKEGLLAVTFNLACTCKVPMYSTRDCNQSRHYIFQARPNDIKTATWRKTYTVERSFDSDASVGDVYHKIIGRIRSGEFSN